VLLLLFVVPLPLSTKVEGVAWLPDQGLIKSASSGTVTQQLVPDGAQVATGQVLLELSNPTLVSQLEYQRSSLREYEARLQQAWGDDRQSANRLAQDIVSLQATITQLETQVAQLLIRSPGSGKFKIASRHELVGSYVNQGDRIATLELTEPLRIRTALTQEQIGLVTQGTLDVAVRLVSQPDKILHAKVSQEVPSATFELPSPVLGAKGGGRLALDGSDSKGTKTTALVFLVDVTIPQLNQREYSGERAYVRFYHPPAPLGFQIFRRLQQLFTRNFAQAL
jgi:putative peptide zinc metalloprotease protein